MTILFHRKKTVLARLLLLAVLLVILVVPVSAALIPGPTDEFYVNDFAGVLSQETTDYIMDVNEDLFQRTGAQIVVVTVDTLDGESLETYATELFREYGIGDAEKNNGVLLLLAVEDREVRIEVGYGMEGAINDAKAGRILDTYALPYFKHEQWDEGILNTFKAIQQEVKNEFAEAFPVGNDPVDLPREYEPPGFFETWEGWWTAAIPVSLVIGIIMYKILEDQAKYGIWIWLAALTVFFWIRYGVFVALSGVFVSSVAALFGYCAVTPDDGSVSSSYSSSSGSRSSGSRSSGSSSGSRSHHGGGGRSGGGGASRKF